MYITYITYIIYITCTSSSTLPWYIFQISRYSCYMFRWFQFWKRHQNRIDIDVFNPGSVFALFCLKNNGLKRPVYILKPVFESYHFKRSVTGFLWRSWLDRTAQAIRNGCGQTTRRIQIAINECMSYSNWWPKPDRPTPECICSICISWSE